MSEILHIIGRHLRHNMSATVLNGTKLHSSPKPGIARSSLSDVVRNEDTKDHMINYKDVLKALHILKSNCQTLAQSVAENDARCNQNIPDVESYLSRAGITMSDVAQLSVIHVSGTKGKGSTCAMIESVLRHHGYRTGLYTSPHLIEVRERIRINGRPLSHSLFSQYFWDVYNKLVESKPYHNDKMPAYFRFLTVMAMRVFLSEKVDVAVFEVGIGGQYDCTNVVRTPVVCAVTSLGLDHTQLLGDTVESIAWHKAGIFKTGVPAVTAPQKPAAMAVLEERSRERQSPLYTAPAISVYSEADMVELGVDGKFQWLNASVALQVTHIWLLNHDKDNSAKQWTSMNDSITCLNTFHIHPNTLLGLKNCVWLGRDQVLQYPGLTMYLDGAHTKESLEQCVEWFQKHSISEQRSVQGEVIRVLMFNLTGYRDFTPFIPILKVCNFDYVIFCPNTQYHGKTSLDQTLHSVSATSALKHSREMRDLWKKHASTNHIARINTINSGTNIHGKTPQQPVTGGYVSGVTGCTENSETNFLDGSESFVMSSISEALMWVSKGRSSNIPCADCHTLPVPSRLTDAAHIQLLVTGSMHLVGAVLGYVDPGIVDRVR